MAWLCVSLALLFLLSALPLLLLIARRDTPVLLVALPLIVVRAAASGAGFAWGMIRPYAEPVGADVTFKVENS